MTAAALAELIGVSRQAVSQYEKGPHTPAPAVMRRIADVLRLPAHFFLRPTFVTADGTIFYRSMAAATKAARTRAEVRFKWTREFVNFLRVFVNLPKVNYPQIELSGDPLAISESQIEETATSVRRHWRLGDGPISNIVLLLENNGTIVVRHDLGANTLDAFSMWSTAERTPYVILNSEKGGAVRGRLNAAHELGHLILHHNLPPGFLRRVEMFDLIEEQATHFGAAFLMPAKTFAADVYTPTLDAFRALKPKWKVSIQAMILRAKSLGLIDAEQERRLWPNLARRGWRTCEPLDDTLEPEAPRLLRRSLDLALTSGVTTKHDVLFQNALSAEDIEDLVGLSRGYFGAGEDEDPSGPGEPTIIQFPTAS